MTVTSVASRMRWIGLVVLITVLFAAVAVQQAFAEQSSSSCGGVTCVRQTTWAYSDGSYRSSAASSTGSTFYAISTDMYGYNIYHYGSFGAAIDHEYSYCPSTTFCSVPAGWNCSSAAPPTGCGGGTANWYDTTLHFFRQTNNGPDFSFYTSTDGTRSSYTCLAGSGTCF
jgi:hypothetical protein